MTEDVLAELARLRRYVAELEAQREECHRTERRLRLISAALEQSAEGIAVVDLEGRLIFLNDAFASAHGYTPDELVGQHLSVFHTPDQMPAVEEANRRLLAEGEFDGEIWHVRRDGSVFPAWMHNALLRGEAGNVVGVIGTLRDITDRVRSERVRKQSELELREAHAQLNATLDALPDILFEVDREGRIYGFHAPNPDLLYLPPVEFLCKTVEEVLPPDAAEIIMAAIAEAAEQGRHKGAVYALDMPAGRCWFELSISAKGDPQSPDARFITLVRDITERVRSEEQYRSLVENLPIGVYRTTPGPQGRFLVANPAACAIFGFDSEEEMQSVSVADLYMDPDERLAFSEHLLARGRVAGLELYLKRKDGSPLWGSVTARAVRDEQSGEVAYFDCVIDDVTERKKAEEELRKRNAQLEALRRANLELTAQMEGETLFGKIVFSAIELVEGIAGELFLYRPGRDELELVALAGGALGEARVGDVLRRAGDGSHSFVAQVWETGRPQCAGALVGTPLRWRAADGADELLGVLVVVGAPVHHFSAADADLLGLFGMQAAIAIHNVRLYESERKWARRLDVVNQVARKAASILDPARLLDEIVAAIQTGFGYFNVTLLQLDEATNELGNQAVAGGYKDISPPDYRQKVGEGLIGWAAETGQAVLSNDVTRDPRYIVGYRCEAPTRAEMCVPLKLGDQVIGVLDVQEARANAFDEVDLMAMETLADQIAVAIANARLYEETRKRADRLAVVNHIARAVGAALRVDDLLETVYLEVTSALETDAFFIALYDDATQELDFRLSVDEGIMDPPRRQPLGSGWASYVVTHKEPLLLHSSEQKVDGLPQPEIWGTMRRAESWLGAPMRIGDWVVGVICVQSYLPNVYDEEDLLLLTTIADQVAIALETARLYEDARRRATEQEVVSRIAAAFNTLDLQAAFPTLVDGLHGITGCDRVSLAMIYEDSFVMATIESPFPALETGVRIPSSATAAADDVLAGRPHLTPDLGAEMDFPAERALYEAGFRSRVNLPLLSGGEVIGSLNLASQVVGAFSRDQLPVLQQIADAVAAAVENNRLFRAEQEQRKLAESLAEVAAAVNTLDFDEVLDHIVAQVGRIFGEETICLLLLENDNETVRVARWRGEGGTEQVLGAAFPLAQDPVLKDIAESGRTLLISEVPADYASRLPATLGWIHSVIIAPIQITGQILGFLVGLGAQPERFNEVDARRFKAFADYAGTAIENVRLFEETERRMESLRKLNLASQALTSSLDMKEILQRIVSLAGEVMGSDYTTVLLVNEDGLPTLEAEDMQGAPPLGQRVRRDGFTRYVLDHGQPLFVNDIAPDGSVTPALYTLHGEILRANPALVAAGIRSLVAAPIRSKDKTVGVLFVHSRTPHAFREQLPLLTTFANQAAVAIENARLFEAEQSQRALAEALAEAAAAVASLNLDEVLDRVLEQIGRVVAGDEFNIMLIEGNDAHIVRRRSQSQSSGPQRPLPHSLALEDFPILLRMARTGEPMVVEDTATHPDWVLVGRREDAPRAYVGAPVWVEGAAAGFLNVNSFTPNRFGAEDARRLATFASYVATALKNARLHQEVRDYAELLEERVRERTAALAAQYARLEAILNSTTDGIVVADAEGRILQMNPIARNWIARPGPPEDRGRIEGAVRGLAAQAWGRPEITLDLAGLDLELKAAPISEPEWNEAQFLALSAQSEPSVVVAIHDISEMKALDRMKTNFVTNAAHELRTPISTIKLYTHLVRTTPPGTERWRQYAADLAREVDDHAQLSEDIVQLSRIYSGRAKREMNPRPISLPVLVEAAIARHQSLIQQKELELTKTSPGGSGEDDALTVLVDVEQMVEVFSHLVEGAVHYTPAGGRIGVFTGWEEADGRIWATVRIFDSGEVIPEDDMPYLFSRLFREGDSREPRSERVRKTGLRLMSVKEIVTLHGGQIEVDSRPGEGVVFTIRLPVG